MYMYLHFVPIWEIYILLINIETKVMSTSVIKYNSSTTTISVNRFYFICSSIGKYQLPSCEMKSIVLYRDWILKTVMGMAWFRVMVFNAIFNNISAILWRSVLLMEKTEVPGENQTIDLSQVTDKFIIQYCIEYTSPWAGFELKTLVEIVTDCIGSWKSNYHTITTTTTPYTYSKIRYDFHVNKLMGKTKNWCFFRKIKQ